MASNDKQRGAQFDILDKALASRLHELLARPYIARQDYDFWMTGYRQLEAYARENSDVAYVRSQWEMEQRNYQGWPERLLAKVRTANPINYDTSISVSGRGACSSSNIPQLPYSPLAIPPSTYGGMPSRGGTNLFFGDTFAPQTIGDGLRGLFNPSDIPFLNPPTITEEIKRDTLTGIIVALVVGAVLWGIHSLRKKYAG